MTYLLFLIIKLFFENLSIYTLNWCLVKFRGLVSTTTLNTKKISPLYYVIDYSIFIYNQFFKHVNSTQYDIYLYYIYMLNNLFMIYIHIYIYFF